MAPYLLCVMLFGDFSYCGQNIARTPGNSARWEEANEGWYGEVKDFVFGGDTTNVLVGHYTQVS